MRRECKPRNYNLISANLHGLTTTPRRRELILQLERAMLKSLLVQPPDEFRPDVRQCMLLRGRRRSQLNVILALLPRTRTLSSQIVRGFRFRQN